MNSPLFATRSSKNVPVQHRRTETTPSRKLISVPVHFISSSTTTKVNSAVKIQKAFRGYLVRNSMKKIKEITRQVNEIEQTLSEKTDILKRDEKERLRVNEALMKLLIRLDSVNGVCDGVRECRKSVIKTVIRLQEVVDHIVSSCRGDTEEKVSDGILEYGADCVGEKEPGEESVGESSSSSSSSSADIRGLIDEEKEVVGEGGCNEIKGNENKRSRELLERMMEDNEKMMGLMSELFERNEMQTRVLNSLVLRVEQLERAFMCEKRLKRKNKKKNNGGVNKLN